MADPAVPIQDGVDIGASGSHTFDFSATGLMGRGFLINAGPGIIAVNFTDTPPADTSRGTGRNQIQVNGVLNLNAIKFEEISIRADGSGAGVDVLVMPGSGSRGSGF